MDSTEKADEFMLIQVIGKQGIESYVEQGFAQRHNAQGQFEAKKMNYPTPLALKTAQVLTHMSAEG